MDTIPTLFLDTIDSPDDVKKLETKDLPILAAEIRERIISVVRKNGGHLASNLGVVELTIALHRCFSTPDDKIIWDVGHQCYTHKLLTGRREQFSSIRKKDGLSGFPKRSESVHDTIETGHSSTSISSALGVLTGERLSGDQKGKVIAVIGDGALTGGMAFEALNHAGHLGRDLIVVYNDNNWSISPNVGGLSLNSNLSKLSSYVSRLGASSFYQSIRNKIDRGIRGIPFLGVTLFSLYLRLKKALKAAVLKETIFSELGFEYIGPVDGHSFKRLTDAFSAAKRLDRPVVIHTVTKKGKGDLQAEGDPTAFHGVSPVINTNGKLDTRHVLSYTEAFSEALLVAAEGDERIVAVTPAMAEGSGLAPFRQSFPKRFFDVGISEQHAVTFSAGLALSGMRPVCAIYSTFMQRAVDQLIHDVALPGLPVIFCLDRAGLVGSDGETHQGLYDIALCRSIPGLTIMAPAFREEFSMMMDYALSLEAPVLIRYPKDAAQNYGGDDLAPMQSGQGCFLREGRSDTLIISFGAMTVPALDAANRLEQESFPVDIYHLRFAKPLHEAALLSAMKGYRKILFVEDASAKGGLGELLENICSNLDDAPAFFHIGAPDSFLPHASRGELLRSCGLDGEGIADAVQVLSKRAQAVDADSKIHPFVGSVEIPKEG